MGLANNRTHKQYQKNVIRLINNNKNKLIKLIMPNGHYSNKGNVPAKASCFDSKLQRMEFA